MIAKTGLATAHHVIISLRIVSGRIPMLAVRIVAFRIIYFKNNQDIKITILFKKFKIDFRKVFITCWHTSG